MRLNSVLLVALLGTVAAQGPVIKIEQSTRLSRDYRSVIIAWKTASVLLLAFWSMFRHCNLSMLLLATCKSRLMTGFRSQGQGVLSALLVSRIFMDVKVEPLLDGMFDVPQVATFLIAGPDGYIAQFIGQGLAIDGIYQGRGEGNFFVSFLEGQVYRYPNGIQSRQSVDLGLTDVFGDCPYDEAAGATLRIKLQPAISADEFDAMSHKSWVSSNLRSTG
ncbi:hypothetical protein FOZ63_029355 [Perkinsus olseni]|uniref:Uncharacterized protein n=1 Tax=Perkinsus olseni TaxID=32597 RepID=A0A7J6Q8M4_PEROL|nr:hypothetical protein FOZ63_029355 [Perkinsus olseni]